MDRLQAALGTAYRLDHELGGGGMSRVFVAEDTSLGRKVVVKVLPPEMAAGVNADRFRREIQLAASLQHPHIVPLLHAGHVDDLVFYTMPLIEGDSLRAKLTREGELPIPEAVRLLRDVADALAYAHDHGVVHRDIKPDNVLVARHHAVVTDFGVAKALGDSTGRGTLTSLGVALGTPAYMAPEQAAADPHVDHRADLYALGALAYEMLTGRPPFTGMTPHQILAAHVTQEVEPITRHRASVPPALAELVMRCLEKKPADRWQTASEVHAQLEGIATPSGGMEPTRATPAVRAPAAEGRSLPRRAILAAAAVVLVLLAVVALWGGRGPADRPVADRSVLAVLPFRVSGADPSLHYLREGMIDLLAAKFTGEGGPRAADPRTVTSAWRRAVSSEAEDLDQAAAVSLAARLGAGQLLLGGIVGSPGRVVLNASLVEVPGGATRAQVSVEGPADSLPALIDRLAAGILLRGTTATRAGGGESPLTGSLDALKAYLEGQAAYRRGDYEGAARDLGRALQLDSTFTLAAHTLLVTEGWGVQVPDLQRVQRLAWAGRERLSQRDRALLEAYLGPNYPEPSLWALELNAREKAVQLAPDHPDAWYFLGDAYFHVGTYLGYADRMERATAAFRRALALDSTFAGPLSHMVDLAVEARDTAEARRVGRLFLGTDGGAGGGYALVVRWRLAHLLGDAALREETWTSWDTVSGRAPFLPLLAQSDGAPAGEVDRLFRIMSLRASSQAERVGYYTARAIYLLELGRPRDALAALDSLEQVSGDPAGRAILDVLHALYVDGDTTAAVRAAARLAPLADGALADSAARRAVQYDATCAREQWRVANGRYDSAPRAVARLRGAGHPRDLHLTVRKAHLCALLIDAMAAVGQGRPDAVRLVERADSVMRQGPLLGDNLSYQNLAVGRLFAAVGEYERALAAVRRGGYFGATAGTYHREEGRLAEQTGDREGAVRAWARYLRHRSDPEPELRPAVEAIRARLAELAAEPPR